MTIARRIIYPLIGVLILAVAGLSFYQVYLLNFSPDPSTYIGVPAIAGALPTTDNRGVFLQLLPGVDDRFPSSLVQLLETNEADAVPADKAFKISANAFVAVIVNQVVLSESSTYLIYRPGQNDEGYEFDAQRQPGGKLLIMTPKSGHWLPGQHIVEIPPSGMFDTASIFYTFVVTEETNQ